jgi:hypothetical protein
MALSRPFAIAERLLLNIVILQMSSTVTSPQAALQVYLHPKGCRWVEVAHQVCKPHWHDELAAMDPHSQSYRHVLLRLQRFIFCYRHHAWTICLLFIVGRCARHAGGSAAGMDAQRPSIA